MNSPFGNTVVGRDAPASGPVTRSSCLQGPADHWRLAALRHLGRRLRRPKQRQPRPAFEHAIEQLQCWAARALNMRGGPCSFAG